MVRRHLRWWVLGLFSGFVGSQENCFAQADSSGQGQNSPVVSLSAVTVRAIAPERFLAGQKIQRIDSATLRQFQFGSLIDLLSLNTPIAFKNYGPGQLATVAFRGTSASHTAVLWNGININQPNLGLTDFSTLPVAGFDRLSVQYGSSASVVGSGAVGGSILLGSSADWQRTFSVTLGQQFASFQNNQTQAGVRYATALGQNWKLSGKTFAYQNKFNNVYPYTERQRYFVEPSTTAQRGFVQDVYFLHKSGKQFSVNAWLSDNDLIITPLDTIARERTRTQSARLLATYEANNLTVRLGWIRDVLDYGKGNFNQPKPYRNRPVDWSGRTGVCTHRHTIASAESTHWGRVVALPHPYGWLRRPTHSGRPGRFIRADAFSDRPLAGVGQHSSGLRHAFQSTHYAVVRGRISADSTRPLSADGQRVDQPQLPRTNAERAVLDRAGQP